MYIYIYIYTYTHTCAYINIYMIIVMVVIYIYIYVYVYVSLESPEVLSTILRLLVRDRDSGILTMNILSTKKAVVIILVLSICLLSLLDGDNIA